MGMRNNGGSCVINFDTLMQSFNMMIILLINNNWHSVMEAAVLVTNEWVYLYFAAFYIFGVVYFFNLVIAVTIQAFTVLQQMESQEDNTLLPDSFQDKQTQVASHMLFLGDDRTNQNVAKYQN